MIVTPDPLTYAQFKVLYNAIIQKHDAVLVYTKDAAAYVARLAVVFSNTPSFRLDLQFSNPELTATNLLVNFPEAMLVASISVGA